MPPVSAAARNDRGTGTSIATGAALTGMGLSHGLCDATQATGLTEAFGLLNHALEVSPALSHMAQAPGKLRLKPPEDPARWGV